MQTFTLIRTSIDPDANGDPDTNIDSDADIHSDTDIDPDADIDPDTNLTLMQTVVTSSLLFNRLYLHWLQSLTSEAVHVMNVNVDRCVVSSFIVIVG